MIEESRYARLVYHMGKDIRYLFENFQQHRTPLTNVFGDIKAKDIENRLRWVCENQCELANDLVENKFYDMAQEIDHVRMEAVQLRNENVELKRELQVYKSARPESEGP